MGDISSELANLRQELRDIDEAFWREFYRTFARWNIGVGSFRINAPATSAQLAIGFFLFNSMCFAVGIIFTVLGGVWTALGVAMIVGSLFSFGTFVAQLWVVHRQRAAEVIDRLYGLRTEYADLERLGRMRKDLLDRIEKLSDSLETSQASESPESKPTD